MTTQWSSIDQIKRYINDLVFQPEEILEKTTTIYSRVINNPKYINEGNFTKISDDVLGFLFSQYDSAFFEGLLWNALENEKDCISFLHSVKILISNDRFVRVGVE